jgi:hypothetical protein
MAGKLSNGGDSIRTASVSERHRQDEHHWSSNHFRIDSPTAEAMGHPAFNRIDIDNV